MSKWNAFKLRMSLLKIWFVKNLTVFIELVILISVVLILTGQIDNETPVLGIIFGDLSAAINEIINQRYSDDIVVNLLTIVISLLVTVGTLSSNLKRIALSDIRNPELKKMLIRAGLYFNKDGKLVKKVEVATRMDLDGDNKVGDVEITEIPREGLVPGLKRSMEELGTILSVKIETEAQVEQIKQQASLKETEAAVNEILPTAADSAREVTIEQIVEGSSLETIEARRNIFAKAFDATKALAIAGAVAIKNGVASSASWVWSKISAIGSAIGGFFKKLFTRQERPLRVKKEKVAKAKKQKVEPIVTPLVQPMIQEQPQVMPQPQIQSQTVSPRTATLDPIEALKKKYGR